MPKEGRSSIRHTEPQSELREFKQSQVLRVLTSDIRHSCAEKALDDITNQVQIVGKNLAADNAGVDRPR